MPRALTIRGKLLSGVAAAALGAAVAGVVGAISSRALLVGSLVTFASAFAVGCAVVRSLSRSLARLAAEACKVRDDVRRGQLHARADTSQVGDEFRPVLDAINDTMDAFATPVALSTRYLTQLAAGEAPPLITEECAGEFDRIKQSLNELVQVSDQRGKDLDVLVAAAVDGRLDHRADPGKYRGGNARLIESLNRMLDALSSPVQLAASCVERIARGDLSEKIAQEHGGDLGVLTRNLNTCIDAVQAVVADADQLARAAVQGRLGVRADPSRHQGDFRTIIAGVNAAMDAIVGPLLDAATCVEQISRGEIPPHVTQPWAGDLVRLRDNLNTCIDAIRALVHDTDALVQFALAGKLATRADVSLHRGDFARIVDGVNRTLDAVMAPVNATARILERLSTRDLRARVLGRYLGEHARITDAVNDTSGALHDAISQVAKAVEQVSGAATQIASSSQSVASGASQQATSLEAISASNRDRIVHDPPGGGQRPARRHAGELGAHRGERRHGGRRAAPVRHEQDPAVRRGHRPDHPGRVGHRVSDQPPRAQRSGGGRSCRGVRARLRRRGRRGAVARAPCQAGGHQDRGPHPSIREGDGRRRRCGPEGLREARADH